LRPNDYHLRGCQINMDFAWNANLPLAVGRDRLRSTQNLGSRSDSGLAMNVLTTKRRVSIGQRREQKSSRLIIGWRDTRRIVSSGTGVSRGWLDREYTWPSKMRSDLTVRRDECQVYFIPVQYCVLFWVKDSSARSRARQSIVAI
jgi:hypothetical protein